MYTNAPLLFQRGGNISDLGLAAPFRALDQLAMSMMGATKYDWSICYGGICRTQ
jgi:hypothetical protein